MRSILMSSVAACAVVALFSAGTASAQSSEPQAPAQDDRASDQVEDIIVTAERVSTSIQRTPISIQAYSGEELQNRGVNDISALSRADSSVNINLSAGMPVIAIRGVSSQNATEVGDPAVSVAIDGIFTNRPYGTFGGLYDIERVEILRGPQGTLFGRNSTGGTINVITARPTSTNEGRITAEIGNYNLFAANGFANFAITDTLDGRLSFDVRSRDGYRNNAPSVDGDDEDLKSGRFQLAWRPTESLSGWILGQYTKQAGQGNIAENIPFVYGPGSTTEPLHVLPPTLSDGETFTKLAPNVRDLEHWEVRGGLTYNLANGMSINYLGGYDRIRYFRQQAQNDQFTGVGNGPAPLPFVYRNTESPDTINQELRLSSDPGGRFTWQVGAYYFKETSSVLAQTIFNPVSNTAAEAIRFDYPDIEASSKALFAQGSYGLTEQLKLTVGGRYTWDEKSRDGTFFIFSPQTGLPFTITIPQPASSKSDQPTWSVGLDYQMTPENMIYGKVSTGYKVGGFNSSVSAYDPETVTSYEIGSKNYFFDNHLQLNVTGYRMDYADQQVVQFVSGATSSGSATVNAGESRIWGVEMNAVLQSYEMGRLTLSANYTRARYLEFLASAGWDASINLDLSGNRLPLSPELSFSARYEKTFDLAGGTLTPSVAVKYQSEQFFAATNFENQKQDAYAYVDLGLDYSPASLEWTLQAFVKNLTDEVVFSEAGEFYTFNNYTYAYQPPRTYGARLTVNF